MIITWGTFAQQRFVFMSRIGDIRFGLSFGIG